MTTLAIEINDAGILVADREAVLCVEPGYALVDGGEILTGVSAYGQARIKPRQVSSRFWGELSMDEGSASVAGVSSAAELAFAQLQALWRHVDRQSDDVVLVVPSFYRQQQLGLLLGLAQECGMTVRAMVDVAVAASIKPYPGQQLIFVDAGLHRVSVTTLEQGDEVSAQGEKSLEATGLVSLAELFAKRLAEIFVLATRFDPLHKAETEQLLYDRLPAWLQLLYENESAELALPYGDEEFSVEVERAQLLGAAGWFYKALLQLIAQSREAGSGLVVQLSDRLLNLPGLLDELARLDDARVVGLPSGHAAQSALLSLNDMDAGQEQVKLLRHLSWRASPAEQADVALVAPAARVATSSTVAPTHVVYRGFAYSVDGSGLLIGRSKSDDRRVIVIDDQSGGVSRSHCELSLQDGELKLRDLSSFGTYVNEKRISGEETLRPADIIRVGSPGAELQVVTVENNHGA